MKKTMQCACYSLDDKEGRLLIEVELPEIEKKEITLDMSKARFHVTPHFVRG